jgi:hypothetical protein
MNRKQEPRSLEQVLERLGKAEAVEGKVSLGAVLHEIGDRSFGPLLLVEGLITFSPVIGDIPGVSALMGVCVLLTVGQMLFRRKHFWLPQRLLKLSVVQPKFCKVLGWFKPAARFADRLLEERLTPLVRGAGAYMIAIVCAAIALILPAMELVPFSAYSAGFVLILFGLSLIARDGLLALIALTITVSTAGLVTYGLLH